jgi:hypothetical protein
MYRARDRRVFTTDDVSFVETDIQLPDYILELELAGLLSVTAEDGLLIDAHAERDDEVDGEQLSLDRFDDQYTQASGTPPFQLDRAGERPASSSQASDTPLFQLDRAGERPASSSQASDTTPFQLDRAGERPASSSQASDTTPFQLDRAGERPALSSQASDTPPSQLVQDKCGTDSYEDAADETDTESVYNALMHQSTHRRGPSMGNILLDADLLRSACFVTATHSC